MAFSHCARSTPCGGSAGAPVLASAATDKLRSLVAGPWSGLVSERCSTSSVGPRLHSTARSITWLSSRTLPGHGYDSNNSRAGALISRTVFPYLALRTRRKWSVRSSTSSPRSRSGGTTSTITARSEEHTSELQSRFDLVCRLLLEKKKKKKKKEDTYTI